MPAEILVRNLINQEMLQLSQKENVLQWKDSKYENNISIYITQYVTYVLNLLCSFFSISIFGILYCF